MEKAGFLRSWASKTSRIWTGRWQGAGFQAGLEQRLGGWKGTEVKCGGTAAGGNGMRGQEMPQGAEICLAGMVGPYRDADG